MNYYEALLITIDAGDEELFSTLENSLLQAIPESTVEWRRSFGRPIKQVKLGASFVSFSRDILPNEKDWHLINQPVLHIYWSECTVSEIKIFRGVCVCVYVRACIVCVCVCGARVCVLACVYIYVRIYACIYVYTIFSWSFILFT